MCHNASKSFCVMDIFIAIHHNTNLFFFDLVEQKYIKEVSKLIQIFDSKGFTLMTIQANSLFP